MKVLILSDIHGNRTALEAVLNDAEGRYNGVILLGDLIDYGPNSDSVIEMINNLSKHTLILCNIRGNHEKAIIEASYAGFSTDRGIQCAKYTRSSLHKKSLEYITQEIEDSGVKEFILDSKKCLAVHGSLEDIYWKAIEPKEICKYYGKYDYVFSGHSHIPHFFEVYYKSNNFIYRNKKKTVFINPGSVGQPRNLNPLAQYSILDTNTESVMMLKIEYNIELEQQDFSEHVDSFYKERLKRGI